MNRQIIALAILLLMQSALVALFYWPQTRSADTQQNETLLSFDPDTIDEIYITDDQDNEAVLLNLSGQWLLPDLGGIPADPQMVSELLTAINHRTAGWPIATTNASRQRFQVAAYQFQRRLTLIGSGELLGSIYLGTSPGFRKVHARNDARDEIYSIPFNNYDAPAQAQAWLDKALLQTPAPERISSGDYTITLRGEKWFSSQGGAADERELAALLLGLRSLQVDGIADASAQRSLAIAAPDLALDIARADTSQQLEFFTLGEQHFVRSNRYKYFFALSAYDFDRLVTIDASALNTALAPEKMTDVTKQ
ncbi:MAG: DUF4340 domain-containing protein [Halioglobus sp.]